METSAIQAGCLWQYPCLAQNGPCIDGAVCFQKDYNGFKCECDRPSAENCVKEGFQEGVFGTNIPRGGGRPVAVSFFDLNLAPFFKCAMQVQFFSHQILS